MKVYKVRRERDDGLSYDGDWYVVMAEDKNQAIELAAVAYRSLIDDEPDESEYDAAELCTTQAGAFHISNYSG